MLPELTQEKLEQYLTSLHNNTNCSDEYSSAIAGLLGGYINNLQKRLEYLEEEVLPKAQKYDRIIQAAQTHELTS